MKKTIIKETINGYQPKLNNIDKSQTPDCESFVILPIKHEYEKGFEAGYAKGILDEEKKIGDGYFAGVRSGEKIRTYEIIEFLKRENNGEHFRQSYDVGNCINQLCDKYGFSEMKYSDEELDDMNGTYESDYHKPEESYMRWCFDKLHNGEL